MIDKAGTVDISVRTLAGFENLDAKFSLDLLDAGDVSSGQDGADEVAEKSISPGAQSGNSVDVWLAGHVSRRGDVEQDKDGWIGGPKLPSAIEGLEITCRGGRVGVAAQVLTAKERSVWSEWYEPGEFIGTRQTATSLTGLRLKLVGPEAGRFELVGKAMFLASAVMERRGREIEFRGGNGGDALVGLTLRIVPESSIGEGQRSTSAPRVRVYR